MSIEYTKKAIRCTNRTFLFYAENPYVAIPCRVSYRAHFVWGDGDHAQLSVSAGLALLG